MNSTIASLAGLLRTKRAAGQQMTLLLGAGASISSGVMPTASLVRELVDKHGQNANGEDIPERFDNLWENTPETTRALYLEPYLTHVPSSGYRHLASLIKEGYFDVVVTFNYDNLVELALHAEGMQAPVDYTVIVRGDHKDERVVSMMEARQPRVKILKLHGSLLSGDTFLFSKEEMLIYPDRIDGLVRDLTRHGIIVCGYGFEDMCVLRSFSADGDSIYCVNPSGSPANLKGFLIKRRSNGNVIDKEDGKFDNFFEQLHLALSTTESVPQDGPRLNPFKFLESYDVAESAWFAGRRPLTNKILAGIDRRCVHILGRPKVGKTSLIRAGLMAKLDLARYEPLYFRCTGDLEQNLPQSLKGRLGEAVGEDLQSTLTNLAASQPEKRVVLILDQFERVIRRFPDNTAGGRALQACLRTLCRTEIPNLTVILVAVYDPEYVIRLTEMGEFIITVKPFEARNVARILRFLARMADVRCQPDVVDALSKKYEDSRNSQHPFTLAHVHAIAHLMCARPDLNAAAYREALKEHEDSLNKVINQCDVLSFVEDCPLEEQRALLCNILKIVYPPGKQQIAEFLRDHFSELLVRTRPRRPADGNKSSERGIAHAATR